MSRDELVHLRREEARRALQLLGVGESGATFWDFEDGSLTQNAGAVTERIAEFLRANEPRQVLVTSAQDRHPDHVAVALSARAAVAAAGQVALYEYPIWQRVPAINVARRAMQAMLMRDDSKQASPMPVPRLVRTDGFVARKECALEVYESQLPHFPIGFTQDFMLAYEAFTQIRFPGRSDRTPW
jgi:LmbE family N-acetylglucosaminyl deacetylase